MNSGWNNRANGRTADGLSLLRDVDASYSGKYIRPNHVKWGVPYEEWRDDASCVGLDTRMFELTDEPKYLSESGEEAQQERIAEGLKICVGCPVKLKCDRSATELDKYWTTRGGRPPEGLFGDVEPPKYQSPVTSGFARTSTPAPRKLKEKCNKGHSEWAARGNGQRRCVPCAKQHEANRKRGPRARR